jgi:hypothetical protein
MGKPWTCKHCGAILGYCDNEGLRLLDDAGEEWLLLPIFPRLVRVVVRCLVCRHTRDWFSFEG